MEILGINRKRGLIIGLLFCLMAWWTPVLAQEAAAPETAPEVKKEEPPVEDKPTASVGVDILSQYIWRGFALSRNSAVFQPSLTAAYKGFSVNIWGNFDTGEDNPFLTPNFRGAKWNETDFTAGYSRELYAGTAIKSISANIGVIYYALDSANSPQGDSFEIYYGLAADVNWFKLAATANQEVFHYPGWWLTLGISRVFELPFKIQDNNNVTFELGHNFLFLFSRDQVAYPDFSSPGDAFNGPLAGQLYATLYVPVHKYVTIAPKVGFWYAAGGNSTPLLSGASWDNQQNHIYGGLNVTFAY
ncbi:MAG: TorF family putative porin [Thermodesulfobacteriota bacterium]